MSGISPRNGRVFHQRRCSDHRCAVLLVCVTSSVGCAAPKALATHMAKFLSPLRGFVAPLSGADSNVAFRGLHTLRVLAHGYEKSRPAGGNAAARPIGSRRRDAARHAAATPAGGAPILLLLSVGCALFECLPTATESHALRAEMPLRGPSEAAGGTHRGTPSAAGGTPGGTAHAAGGTPGGTSPAAGGTPRGTAEAAGGTPGGMSVIMASDTPVCHGRRLPRRPCGPTITRPRCSPSCSKRRFHSSWRCSR